MLKDIQNKYEHKALSLLPLISCFLEKQHISLYYPPPYPLPFFSEMGSSVQDAHLSESIFLYLLSWQLFNFLVKCSRQNVMNSINE